VDRTGLTGNYDVSLNVTWEAGTTQREALTQALSDQVGLTLSPSTAPLDLLMVQAAKEAAPASPLSTESQPPADVVAQGGEQTSISEKQALELARLRNEAVRLRDEVAQLRQLTGEMGKAESGTNALVIDENVWSISRSSDLAMLPPAFILRPTRFASDHRGGKFGIKGRRGLPGGFLGGSGAPTGGNSPMQVLGANISFTELMATAFDADVYKLILPAGAPAGGFDLLMTGPDATRERLQAEIKSQFGYAAHIESRPTNVLLLTLRHADAPGLQPSKSTASGGGGFFGGATMHLNNVPISHLVSSLQRYFDPPIIDRSGLTGKFDISLDIGTPGSDAIKQSLTEQLGLGLNPGVEPLDLLVVEADKGN
ncbi:MAG TPA: TIGR03435 family protein, partial [Candidatus Acidoferrum sp.]|nr:TIGR03435 family protein [Candidatus Acidoferrum sp.]